MNEEEFQEYLKETMSSEEYLNSYYDNIPKYHLLRPGLEQPITYLPKIVCWWNRLKLKFDDWKMIILSRI